MRGPFQPKVSDYSGRASVRALDEVLISVHKSLFEKLNDTHEKEHSPTSTEAASLLFLHSGLSLTFAIRALCATGYLFPAEVLLRPVIERIAVQNFLSEGGQEALQRWVAGEQFNTNKLLRKVLRNSNKRGVKKAVSDGLAWFHKHVHPDPLGATWHAERDEELGLIFSSSVNTDSGARCDLICDHARTLLEILTRRVLPTSDVNMSRTNSSITFPGDPYLNRRSVQVLDSIMNVAFTIDKNSARQTHNKTLDPLQAAATLLLPHTLSAIAGIRQLIKVAHLIPAYMLLRPALERIALLCFLERKGHAEAQRWLKGDELSIKIEEMVSFLPRDFGDHPFDKVLEELHDMIHARPKPILMSMRVLDGESISPTLSQVAAPDYCDSVTELTSFLLIYYGYISRRCFSDIVGEEVVMELVASLTNVGYQMTRS